MPLSRVPARDTPMLPADTYKNDVVLVTDGGTGIGNAIAIEFARAGACIAIVSRSEYPNPARGPGVPEETRLDALQGERQHRDDRHVIGASPRR